MPPEPQARIGRAPEQAARALAGKRVFITGITGMVGANLGRALLSAGADVHALVRAQSSRWRIADVATDLNLHVGDLRDAAAVHRAVGAARPEFIFHLATMRGIATSDERIATVRTNIEGLQNLVEATARISYERFVIAGSSLVYGKHAQPLDESNPPRPSGFFGATKAGAELLGQQLARSTGKPLVILRLFSAYGEWEGAHRLIPTAIFAALDDRPIRLTAPGFRRDLVFMADVVEAFCLAAGPVALDAGEVINIGTGIQTANEETVRLIEQACGKKITISSKHYPPHESDTTDWVADASKAARTLGWQPRHSAAEGMSKTVEWMIANRAAYDSNPARALKSVATASP